MKCEKCGGSVCTTCVVIRVEELSSGILCLSNVTKRQWDEALARYRSGDDPVIILFGLDPSIETKAQFLELPEELLKNE